jgi:hypothetical protein
MHPGTNNGDAVTTTDNIRASIRFMGSLLGRPAGPEARLALVRNWTLETRLALGAFTR